MALHKVACEQRRLAQYSCVCALGTNTSHSLPTFLSMFLLDKLETRRQAVFLWCCQAHHFASRCKPWSPRFRQTGV
eukprot:5404158-Amphidinium_carterae.1